MVPHLVCWQVVFLQLAQVSVQAVDASPHVKQVGCPEIIILRLLPNPVIVWTWGEPDKFLTAFLESYHHTLGRESASS